MGKKTGESRYNCRVSGWGMGAEVMAMNCTRPHGPRTNTKRSQQITFDVTCTVLSFGQLGARLLSGSVQSLIEVPSTRLSKVEGTADQSLARLSQVAN